MHETLAPGVDVWTAQPQALTDPCWRRLDALLDAGERARAGRLHQEPDRRAWCVAHGLLRLALGTALGQPPQSLRFEPDAHGRPQLRAAGAAVPVFSLTHCRALAACAVAMAGPVGIDAEPWQDGVSDALLAGFLLPLPSDRPVPAVQQWTALEACRKADGTGLAAGLPRLALRPRDDGDLDLHDDEGRRPTGLVARRLPAPPGVVLTLACTPGVPVRVQVLA